MRSMRLASIVAGLVLPPPLVLTVNGPEVMSRSPVSAAFSPAPFRVST